MMSSDLFTAPVPADYLRDESKKAGQADAIAFPRDTAELCAALREAAARSVPVTVQGARTGIAAGAVPDGGLVISLVKMDRILGYRTDETGHPLLRVQAGLPLVTLRRTLAALTLPFQAELPPNPLFFPPDPTEPSATLGGMAACNASGACSFAYGPTRLHVQGMTLVLADGDTVTLQRGQAQAQGYAFTLKTDGGQTLSGTLPAYTLPEVKNAAGYWVKPDMDLIDLFIGSEGTLGVIAELELRLSLKPASTLGMLCFLDSDERVPQLVDALRCSAAEIRPHTLAALEYFDAASLALIRSSTPLTGLRLPPDRPTWRCALYLEWALTEASDLPFELTSRRLADYGARTDDTWVAADNTTLEKMKTFRHAVPEHVNALIAERKRQYPTLTKLGTDLSVPDCKLDTVMRLYRTDLAAAGLQHAIFGHIGNNHVHVNILPRNMDEYAVGRKLSLKWAKEVTGWGGSVAAEHGIGRLKKAYFNIMYSPEKRAAMRNLKRVFDPDNRLNPNCLF